MVSSRKKISTNKDIYEFTIHRQIKLDPEEKKSYEIVDDQTQQLIERLRFQQQKKEQLKKLQLRKQRMRKRDTTTDLSQLTNLMVFDYHKLNSNEDSLQNLQKSISDLQKQNGAIASSRLGTNKNSHLLSNASLTKKVRVDRLPKQFNDQVKANLMQQPVTQETDLSKMLKIIQARRQEERALISGGLSSGNNATAALDQMSAANPLSDILSYNENSDQLLGGMSRASQALVSSQDYSSTQTKKMLKINYGVVYRERNNNFVVSGEPYNKRPTKRTQYTKAQFLELSNQIEQKYFRQVGVSENGELVRGFTSKMITQSFTQPNSPNQQYTSFSSNPKKPGEQQHLSQKQREMQRQRIQLQSPLAEARKMLLVSNMSEQNHTFYPHTTKHQDLQQSNFQFPSLLMKNHHMQNSNDPPQEQTQPAFLESFNPNQSRLNATDLLQTHNSRQRNQAVNKSYDRIVSFQPENQIEEIKTIHDRLNNIIIKKQDPNYLFRQLNITQMSGKRSQQEFVPQKPKSKLSESRTKRQILNKSVNIQLGLS